MNWMKRNKQRKTAKKHNHEHYWRYKQYIKYRVYAASLSKSLTKCILELESSGEDIATKQDKLSDTIMRMTNQLEDTYHMCYNKPLFYIDKNNLYTWEEEK